METRRNPSPKILHQVTIFNQFYVLLFFVTFICSVSFSSIFFMPTSEAHVLMCTCVCLLVSVCICICVGGGGGGGGGVQNK